MDLARVIGSECRVEYVGIRPGEKLHEVMVPMDNARDTLEFDDYYMIKPSFRFFERRFCEEGCRPVPEDFEYSSGNNTIWLSVEELAGLVKKL
jgi:UDP-N-acetylglucosamine 4,6-dehydratase